MLRLFKTRTSRVLVVVAMLSALYAIAGFVIAPKLVRSALLKGIPDAIDATPSVGEIRINPFLFEVTIENFSLAGRGGEKLLGFERLFVDFELSSIFRHAYSFGSIDLTAPYVSAAVAKDGSLNLMQLKPKPKLAPQPQKTSGPLPEIRIGEFGLSKGWVSYEDRSQPDGFTVRLEPVDFELREFTSGADGGKFTFTGATKRGERLEWRGHLSVQPIASDGELRIDGLQVRTLWEYLEDKLNFKVSTGSIDLAATYKFSTAAAAGVPAASPGNLQLDVSRFELRDLAVRPRDGEADWVKVPALTVTGTTVDLAKRQAHVDLVSLKGIKVAVWRESDGSFNLMKLAAPVPGVPAPAAVPAVKASVTASPEVAAPWKFDVREFEVREASLSAEDRSIRPAVKVVLAPLSLTVNGASQDLSKPVGVTLDTGIDAKGSLSVNGEVWPQPVAANLSLKLAGVELQALQPYIAQHSSMSLLDGRLGSEAKLHYGAQKGMPTVQFSGNISVEKLHTVDNALRNEFINWDRLDILGLVVTQGPDRLDISQIVVRKPYARVIIEADASMNIKRILTAPGAAPETPPANAPTARVAPPAAPAAAAMPISIGKVVVEAGQANFSDLSVKPNFSTGIQALSGTVTGISSRADARAKVDLRGTVDAYSPVSISGEFNVLGPRLYTDIAMSFRNIELSIFNPYSGKFAGYNIAKGKLITDLHYKVDGRKLDAEHHIVIDQLEFGDKTASKDAVSLPIKLAVSLLKDRNGVIDLNVPVTGSLDDPQFRLAPIIWKVFVNILEKAVTAPFALLGSLFGGGKDIQFIDFQPGVSALDSAANERIQTVAKALIERPQLKIEVPIAVIPDLDRPALTAARFNAELGAAQAARAAAKKGSAAGAALPPYDQLDTAAQLDLLLRVYAKDFGAEPKFPDAVSGLPKPEAASGKIEFLSNAIRAHIQIGDGDLQTLGQDRAKALQEALLGRAQGAAERVFLVANDKATAKDGVVRLELSLQ